MGKKGSGPNPASDRACSLLRDRSCPHRRDTVPGNGLSLERAEYIQTGEVKENTQSGTSITEEHMYKGFRDANRFASSMNESGGKLPGQVRRHCQGKSASEFFL